MSRRFVLSTVGIGLLLNSLKPEEKSQWQAQITHLSNVKDISSDQAAFPKVQELLARAQANLAEGGVTTRRRLSPELNGLYGLYGDQLSSDGDVHYLISTDTGLGRSSARIIEQFMRSQGMKTSIFVPDGLNTATVADFSKGIKQLLIWCEKTLPGYQESGYEVVFNLTAAFKSLQGYLNIMGMFYADQLLYIFEGSSEILVIPRLPIRVDTELLLAHADRLALLAAGGELPLKEITDMPEALLKVDRHGNATISEWGLLVWNRMKKVVLGRERLLSFPFLKYEQSFQKDFKNAAPRQRISVQETLAEASVFLMNSGGNPNILRGNGGKQYDNFTGVQKVDGCPIGHFRINDGDRISCIAKGGILRLRHFGVHAYVEKMECV
ncbi:MAG: CRISPR-associated protein [Deltaproteobacteria bacterium]|nr:CRISPR-associated protein [Deltaproteobacteria bacterium]